MSLTREAYALAERIRQSRPEASRRLRKASVAVPAHVASALCCEAAKRNEHMLAARGALAEVSRQAAGTGIEGSEDLSRLAEELDRLVLFEFGAAEGVS